MFKKRNAGDQLLLAVKLNKVSEISRLVALGVNVNSRIDKNGRTALHYAAHKGQLSSVKALAEAGADVDVTDENGVTPLHRAVIDGHSDVVRVLLEAACSADKKDENGNTALHEAAWNGYSKCVELLVKAKCNVNIHNRTGYTSLHLAAQNCHCKTMETLLKGGANPLAKNNYGDSPLHVAVRYGHVDVCKTLLEKSQENVSEQNNDGNTALHLATGMGHEKLVDMLLKAGSIVTTKNNVGDTARDIAIQNGFKKIAKQVAPSSSDTWKMFKRGRRERRRSCELSSMAVESVESTQATSATLLWVPKPLSQDNTDSKAPVNALKKLSLRKDDSSHCSGSGEKKDAGKLKYKVLTIKPHEMCSIEREYSAFLKKKRARKFPRSHSKSSNKSQEEKKRRSDPGLYSESKNSFSRAKDKTKKSAQSRDDLDISLTPKKSKKDKGLFALFRSTSDPDLTAEMKNGTLLRKKRKDKFPLAKEVMGNGVHRSIPEEVVNEKGETEETKEKRKDRKERGEDRAGKKDKSSKKDREEDKERKEKKEKRRDKVREKEKEKDKKHSRRDEIEGSEGDCSICQERMRKSREKSHKESRHRDKEQRSKYEHKRSRDYYEADAKDRGQKAVEKCDEDKEYRKKKHHHEREKDREKSRKEKHHHHHHHHHKRRSDEHLAGNEVDCGPFPCNTANCVTCKESLGRLEAWQERCTAEIESTRRRLEHRLQRLEQKLEEQQSEERQIKDKESLKKEYDRMLGRVTDECREVSKSVKDSSGDVKEEIRGLIRGGLSKLELKLGQISTGYNIPFMEFEDRCNLELGRNCSADRSIRRAVRSRSSPHLGRAPCEDCVSALEHRGLMSPAPTPLNVSTTLTSGTSSVVSSRANVTDTGSLETVIEARPVLEEEALKVPETILEARPVMEECSHIASDTYAAAQVQHQRQIQEVEKWWRHKAEEEQRVLYARICELEQILMSTGMGDGSGGGSSSRDCFV